MRKRAPGWRAFLHVFPTRPSTEPGMRHRRKALSFCLDVESGTTLRQGKRNTTMSCSKRTPRQTQKSKNGCCGKSPQTGSRTKSLSELMSEWKKENRPDLFDLLDGYRTSAFPDALKAASHGEYPPNGEKAGKRHPHQWRIPKAAIKQWSKQLTKEQAQIQSFRGRAFEELFAFFDEQARSVSGIGPLMVYDTALWVGANIGCLPKDWVYLHAHARIPGVRPSVHHIKKSELPEAFKILRTWKAYEIEDFLCIYHDPIEKLMSRS